MRTQNTGRIVWILLAGVLAVPAHAQTTVAGFTPGSFRVTESGAAEYRIPIKVPPGIAGMEPKLALAYSSQGGNGLLGVGWNLVGLSTITRCPQTLAQDGIRGGVNHDGNDRYCLDGQRLLAISGGYGADGAVYRTEIETFSKLISYGAAGSGPAWFKVWTKSGQILEYGNSADSKIPAAGTATLRLWALSKVSDTKGNFLEVTYSGYDDFTNPQYQPTRISYGGNALAGVPASASVRFYYEVRSDWLPRYVGGAYTRATNRLKGIQTFVGESMVRDYRLTYGANPYNARSQLTQIEECAAGGCLAKTVLGWNPGGVGQFEGTPTFGGPGPGQGLSYLGSDPERQRFADVNGDGRVDLVHINGAGGFIVHLSNGQGAFQSSPSFGGPGPGQGLSYLGSDPSRQNLLDVNGDGCADIVHVNGAGGLIVHLADCQGGFSASPSFGAPGPGNGLSYLGSEPARMKFADVNGDGLVDLIHINGAGGFIVHLNNGQGGFQDSPSFGGPGPGQGLSYVGNDPSRQNLVDVNGDGCADVVHINGSGGIIVHLANCQGQFSASPNFGGPGPGQGLSYLGSDPSRMLFHDVNGDGCVDLVHVNGAGGFIVHLSKCNGTYASTPSFGGSAGDGLSYLGSEPARQKFADVNGDGLVDVVHINGSGGVIVHLNNGAGGFNSTPSFGGPGPGQGLSYLGSEPARQNFYDVRGYGRADLIHINGSGGVIVHPAAGYYVSDALVAIEDGSGKRTDIAYKPITDPDVHAREAAGGYPFSSAQVPLFVCSAYSTSNGLGGSALYSFTYGGFKFRLDGRGLLGFRWMEALDNQTSLKSRTEFRQDWPFLGMASLTSRTQASGAMLGQVSTTYGCTNPASGAPCTIAPGSRYFPFLSQSVETGTDLNGAPLSTVTTTNSGFDLYGNVGTISVSTGDGYSKTTTNIYSNDVPNWLLGRLTRSTVQSTSP